MTMRPDRKILAAAVLALSLALAGCETSDLLDKLTDLDLMTSPKRPLQGERRAVFPEGTPGVPQGVPPELVKGYQQAPDPNPPAPTKQAAEPERPKPKKKVAVAPKKQQKPATQAADPVNAPWPAPPPQQQTGPSAPWPAPQQQPQVAWPDPPPPPPPRR
jgi:hypothetical protein